MRRKALAREARVRIGWKNQGLRGRSGLGHRYSWINWPLSWIGKHTGLPLGKTEDTHSSPEALLPSLPRMPPLHSQNA